MKVECRIPKVSISKVQTHSLKPIIKRHSLVIRLNALKEVDGRSTSLFSSEMEGDERGRGAGGDLPPRECRSAGSLRTMYELQKCKSSGRSVFIGM